MSNIYKINIIGDSVCGKTTYKKLLLGLGYTYKYLYTIGVEVHPIILHTNYGDITLKLWDCAGNPKFLGLADSYYINSHGCIIMHDVIHSKNINYWVNSYKNIQPNNPVVIIGNKIDRIDNDDIDNIDKIDNIDNKFYISCKEEKGLYDPILYLLKQLTNKDDIKII